MIPQEVLKEALKKNKLKSEVYGDLEYLRFTDDFKDIPRGTVLLKDTILWGYPHIGRIFQLSTGIREQFEGPFWVEEKVDGYNVRVFTHNGDVYALTRGGYVCAFTTDRVRDFVNLEGTKLQEKIKREVGSQLMKRYLILEDVLIRDIRLPESVVRAIEEKRKAYEEAQRMQFLLEKEKLEAERKKVEAQGIAEANRIIAGSLTKEYLTWKFIENIQEYAKSPNNTIILIPYDTRMTPIINIPQGGQK